MMNSRERMLDSFHFSQPDKIPVVYSPSIAGIYVHGQKLLDLFNAYPPDNPIVFDKIPLPETCTIDENGSYYEVKKDEWGTDWEYMIFGVTGHPKNYPFNSWGEAKDYNFPPLPSANTDLFRQDKMDIAIQRKDYLVFKGWVSIFEKLHALQPFDKLLMDLVMHDSYLIDFLDRMVDYWEKVITDYIELHADVIVFGDDWGAQSAPIISPSLFREVFTPYYQRLFEPIHKSGKKVFFHSCGYLGGIFDELLELGIDGIWPQIPLYEKDLSFLQKCRENQVAVYIHPDRQYLIPEGNPVEIENYIKRYAERYHEIGGGGIFHVEIENDAPFENIESLVKSVNKYR